MNYLSVVSKCFLDEQGGAPRVAWDQCKLMQQRGHQVTLFCKKVDARHSEVEEHEGIRVVRFDLPATRSLDPFKVRKQLRAGADVVRRQLLGTRWDVVHLHLPIEGKRVADLIGAGPEYVYTVHSPAVTEVDFHWSQEGAAGAVKRLLGRRTIWKLEGELLRRAARIQTLSRFTERAICEFHGDVGDKIRVVPHWCRRDFVRSHSRAEARAALGWPGDATILFTLRHFGPRYGLDVALRAAAPLLKRDPKLRFVMAGGGALRPAIESLARSLGVADRVEFPGRVSDEVLKLCYQAADLFVLPTRALECFGLIVLEAYAFGLPILSTDAGALPELVGPIAPDMLVPAGDVDALESRLRAFLEGRLAVPDPEAIRSYAEERYSYRAVVPRILELIEGRR